MITTTVRISSDGAETGALLQDYLLDRGVFNPKGPATVCYGLSTNRTPRLNGACQSDKITRMRCMQEAGVRLVPWTDDPHRAAQMHFPLFARRTYGMGAKDLVPVFQPEEIPWRVAAGWKWFSEIVPIERELRVWVWRGEVLQSFEKVMQRPADYKTLGRNFGQGFDFVPFPFAPPYSTEAITSTAALGLDFAAIDMLVGKDGRVYVLEANTAPGAIRSGAQRTLAKLADRIEEWCRADCPEYPQRTYASKSEQKRIEIMKRDLGR